MSTSARTAIKRREETGRIVIQKVIIAVIVFGLGSVSVVEAATPVTARMRASFTQPPRTERLVA